METTQKPREETFQIHDPAEKRRHIRREDDSGEPRKTGAVKPDRPARSGSAQKRKPEKPVAQKAAPARAAARQAPGKEASAKVPQKKAAPKKAAPAKKRTAPKPDPDDISTKKRVYGKTKPKKKSAVASFAENLKKKQTARKNRKSAQNRQPTPAVIYTQPQAFNRNRLLVQLLTVVAVVTALVLGLSVFFKVETIQVSGAEVYSEWTIREASGLSEGDNLLTFSHARSAALIKANLPYVDTVRFGIKLPDTVNIIVKEDEVVYAVKDQNGQWWLMNSDGRIVEMGDNSKASNHTQVLGVVLDNPVADERAVAMEAVSNETVPEGETVPIVTTTGAQRLTAALQILKALEQNDIVGEAASVDVTRIEDIILWYGSRYQVNLGDSARLDYKIACMNDVILQMSDYQSGILDISFTIWPNQVGYTPFA